MAVYSIRIPGELKKEMENLKSEINRSEEIRHYIAEKIEDYYRKRRVFMQAIKIIRYSEACRMPHCSLEKCDSLLQNVP